MPASVVSEECDWDRVQKTAVAFTGTAGPESGADARHSRTRKLKGKL
jgi:hypothetical protein